MPYATPTLDQFRTKFPTFSDVADATINDAIEEASASVDTSWIEADYQPAILYLAAHILTVNGALFGALGGGVGGIIAAGLVNEAKVGDAQVKLGSSSGGSGGGSSGSDLASTPYGLQYLRLLRRNQPAVALV